MDWERFDVHLKMDQIEEVVAETLFEEQYRRWKPSVDFRIRPEVDTRRSRRRRRCGRLS